MNVKELNLMFKNESPHCIFVAYTNQHKLEFFHEYLIDDKTDVENYLYLNIDEFNKIFNAGIPNYSDNKILVIRIDYPLVTNHQGVNFLFYEVLNYMDKDIRSELDKKISTCNKQKYFDEYLKSHKLKYGEEWKFPKLKGV